MYIGMMQSLNMPLEAFMQVPASSGHGAGKEVPPAT